LTMPNSGPRSEAWPTGDEAHAPSANTTARIPIHRTIEMMSRHLLLRESYSSF
jgi:hypothetical protein